jgi:putative copper resistance protein D
VQVVAAAALAAPDEGCFAPGPLRALAEETWSGRVLSLRVLLFFGLAAVLAIGRARIIAIPAAVVGLALFLAPFSGHAVTAQPLTVSLALHGVHVAAGLAWIGGVVVLAAESASANIRALLARYSPVATALVGLSAASGIAAAVMQVARWPALFGTAYGGWLLLKLALLAVALAAAFWLRRRYLRSPAGSPLLALSIEAASGLAVIWLAVTLSQMVPGRHADIVWPFALRLNPNLLWVNGAFVWPIAIQLALGAVLLAGAIGFAVVRQTMVSVIAVCLALLVGGVGLSGLVTAAYPSTYVSSPSRFAANNLFSARSTYGAYCADCHGASGHGDGEGMVMAGSAAADLTALHAGDHTAGDMFWWISHGRENSVMPGFEEKIGEADRWDLVNYVRLLSLSARSMDVTGDIAPGEPFLPAIDFSFSDQQGKSWSLRNFEGRVPALIVLARETGSLARYQELAAALREFAQVNLQVIFVVGPEARDLIPVDQPGLNMTVVRDGTDAILETWSAYRRTRRNPDLDDHQPVVGHMEFLVDRFGYVRARYRSDEGLFPSPATIIEQVKALAREPQLRPSPEAHVH